MQSRQPPIPFVDLSRQHEPLAEALSKVFTSVVGNGQFVGGHHVAEFERAFATFTGSDDCVSVGNGTDALVLALRALGIGAGDEVITTAVSFFATAEAICLAGARPVFCDIDPATALLDVKQLPSKLSPHTKAIVPVHLYGACSGISDVVAFARAHDLLVIEDCAQATGAWCDGRHAGTFGDAGCFSFYPSKTLGALGDGGAIICREEDTANRCRSLANHGGIGKYDHDFIGGNSRLDALQAGLLALKLQHFDYWHRQRREIAEQYRVLLAGSAAELLQDAPACVSAHHLFVVRVRDRDFVLSALCEDGILADVHYPYVLPLLPVYGDRPFSAADYPEAHRHAQSVLSLPIFPGMRDDEVVRVADTLLSVLGRT